MKSDKDYLGIQLSKSEKEKLSKAAKSMGLSMTAVIRLALRSFYEKEGI